MTTQENKLNKNYYNLLLANFVILVQKQMYCVCFLDENYHGFPLTEIRIDTCTIFTYSTCVKTTYLIIFLKDTIVYLIINFNLILYILHIHTDNDMI